MGFEKIIKRENGTRFRIKVNLWIRGYRDGYSYSISVDHKLKGKRNWVELPTKISEYEFRSLSMEDREISTKANVLRFVTEDEILEAKLEYWNQLKPVKGE